MPARCPLCPRNSELGQGMESRPRARRGALDYCTRGRYGGFHGKGEGNKKFPEMVCALCVVLGLMHSFSIPLRHHGLPDRLGGEW